MVKIKKIVSIVTLSLAITASSVPLQNVVGTNEVVQAAGVKLSKSSLTLDVGKSATLKVNGTKRKVKWSSLNKNVATVTSKGKIIAKKSGIAIINAKVGKKVLQCKVTVNDVFNSNDAKNNISVDLTDTGSGVLAILKNNNKFHVSVEAKIVYYSNGVMIDTSSDENYAFESGRECSMYFLAPHDSSYNNVPYDDYKIFLSVEKPENLICGSEGIKVETNYGADNISATVENNSGKNLSYFQVAIVYFNSSGKVIGYDYVNNLKCSNDGDVDFITFSFPYNDDYETIYPDSYKVYVNNAYTYTWMK